MVRICVLHDPLASCHGHHSDHEEVYYHQQAYFPF